MFVAYIFIMSWSLDPVFTMHSLGDLAHLFLFFNFSFTLFISLLFGIFYSANYPSLLFHGPPVFLSLFLTVPCFIFSLPPLNLYSSCFSVHTPSPLLFSALILFLRDLWSLIHNIWGLHSGSTGRDLILKLWPLVLSRNRDENYHV